MSDVTDGDRQTAWIVMAHLPISLPSYQPNVREETAEVIAAALAAEREKARAPFLALADELDADAKRHDDAEPVKTDDLLRMIAAARACRTAAALIRRAAEDTP